MKWLKFGATVLLALSTMLVAQPADASSSVRVLGGRCWWPGAHAVTAHGTPIVCVKTSKTREYWHRSPKTSSTKAPSTQVNMPMYHTLLDTRGDSGGVYAGPTYPGNTVISVWYRNGCASGFSKGTTIQLGGSTLHLGNGPTTGTLTMYYYGWKDAGQPWRIVSDGCSWQVDATTTF